MRYGSTIHISYSVQTWKLLQQHFDLSFSRSVRVFALNVFERFGSVQRQTFAVELFVVVVVVTLLCNTHFTSSVRRHRICALSSFV